MRTFYRIILGLSAVAICLGIVMVAVSISNGAVWDRKYTNFYNSIFYHDSYDYEDDSYIESDNNRYSENISNEDNSDTSDTSENYDSNYEDDYNNNYDDNYEYSSEDDYDDNYDNNYDGNYYDDESYDYDTDNDQGDYDMSNNDLENNYKYQNEYANVKSINIDLDYCRVIVKKGDGFSIRAVDMNKNNFSSNVDGDTWNIKNRRYLRRSLFGIGDLSNVRSEVILTVPNDYLADNFELKLKAGSAKVSELSAKRARIDVGAGTFQGGKLTVDESSSFIVGAGEIILDTIDAKNVSIDCGVGRVQMNGTIIGDNKVNCGVGEVSLKLKGNQRDYDYFVDCGLGHVRINEDSYSFTSSTKKLNDGRKGSFDLDCGVGSINVQLME